MDVSYVLREGPSKMLKFTSRDMTMWRRELAPLFGSGIICVSSSLCVDGRKSGPSFVVSGRGGTRQDDYVVYIYL